MRTLAYPQSGYILGDPFRRVIRRGDVIWPHKQAGPRLADNVGEAVDTGSGAATSLQPPLSLGPVVSNQG